MRREQFEWDVLAYPRLDEWLDELREKGWYRDPSVPGIKTAFGTILFEFIHVAAEGQASA